MSFKSDLNYGEGIEDKWMQYLESSGMFNCIYRTIGNYKHFDIVGVRKDGEIDTFEIKADKKWQTTGNIAIEVGTKTSNSGILASKAAYIVYYLEGDSFYFTTIKELRDFYISDNGCREVKGGDNWSQTLLIIPVTKMLDAGFMKVTDCD